MTALLLAVFVASVVGSLHCAGMCGPLLACAVATPGQASQPAELGSGFGVSARRAAWWSRFQLQAAYHGGRLLSYTALGATAGGVGALLDLGGVLSGLQPVAAVLAGGVMIVIGLFALAHVSGRIAKWIKPPAWWMTFVSGAQRAAFTFSPLPRALVIGLCTTLLPCGWLYAFAVTAAGTSSVGWGAAVMAVFWVGTLPLLATLGLGIQGLIGLAGRRLTAISGVAMIVLGVLTLTQRLGLDPTALAATVEAQQTNQADPVPDTDATPACCPVGRTPTINADTPRDAR